MFCYPLFVPAVPQPELERFMEKVEIAANGCWLWQASKQWAGYGRFTVGSLTDGTKRTASAHRWAYEHFVGPIPEGFTIDHLCHNSDPSCEAGARCAHRSCVNPAHLEAVPGRVNILRGKSYAAKKKRATRCQHGHPLSGDNLRLFPSGKRRCRTCERIKQRERNKTEKRKASNRRYQSSAKAKRQRAEYRERTRERNRAYQAAYFQKNKEAILAKRKARATPTTTS